VGFNDLFTAERAENAEMNLEINKITEKNIFTAEGAENAEKT